MTAIRGTKPQTAKTCVLDLLSVAAPNALPATAIIEGGDIMGHNESAIRVALTRLSEAGILHSPSRGMWRLDLNAPWVQEQRRWRHYDKLTTEWDGSWLVANTHRVSRSSRAKWRTHERALIHRGFRELHRDTFVRPANLNISFGELTKTLTTLGMEKKTDLMHVSEMVMKPTGKLWNSRNRRQNIERVLQDITDLEDGKFSGIDLCRQSLVVGRDAVRALNTDPMLPDGLADAGPRDTLAAKLGDYVNFGRETWYSILGWKIGG